MARPIVLFFLRWLDRNERRQRDGRATTAALLLFHWQPHWEESEPLLQERCVATCRRLAPKQISGLHKQKPQDFIPMRLLIMTFNDSTLEFVCGAAACQQHLWQSVVLNVSWLPSVGCWRQDIFYFLIFNWSAWKEEGRGGSLTVPITQQRIIKGNKYNDVFMSFPFRWFNLLQAFSALPQQGSSSAFHTCGSNHVLS